MHPRSLLSEGQRSRAVALFEQGFAEVAVASRLRVSVSAVRRLYDRWRVRGRGALVPKPTRPSYSFEFKLAIVQRFIAGETALDLAREYDLSSPRLIQTWARAYRRDGEDALRPKPKGRARNGGERVGRRELSELEKLRSENARLEAENAYLKKLRALRAQGRQ